MWRPWWPGAALCAWALLVACGEDSGGDDAGTGGSGSAGATSGLPPGTRAVLPVESPRAGECMSSADCSGGGLPGTACATVAGSYKVCAFQTPEATVATNPAGQCDPSRPCATGKCYPVLTFPTGQCGGAGARNVNTCVADECASDADCPEGVCGPRGLTVKEGYSGGAVRQCLKASCKSSTECTARAGGMCALVQANCAPGAGSAMTFLPAQLACVYPNGCTAQSDCPTNSTCRVVSGVGVCVAPLP